jgi:hypothetical protein
MTNLSGSTLHLWISLYDASRESAMGPHEMGAMTHTYAGAKEVTGTRRAPATLQPVSIIWLLWQK